MAHQMNLEYLSRVVFEVKDFLYPDSVVGTDSHTTMVNGLGILGWGKYLVHDLIISIAFVSFFVFFTI